MAITIDGMMKSVVPICSQHMGGDEPVALTKRDNLLLENQPLSDLFQLIEQHKVQMSFWKENHIGLIGEEKNIINKKVYFEIN